MVPLDRLGEAIEETLAIGARHGLDACSWGHAGDGNLHSTFLVDPTDAAELERAARRGAELFAAGRAPGRLDLGRARRRLGQARPARTAMGARGDRGAPAVKRALDPKGLLNPGKKLAR